MVLKQDKTTFTHGTLVNIYVVYVVNKSFLISSYPTIENCLFGAVSLTKNTVDVDIYKYSGHGTGLDRRGTFSVGKGFGRNCITFVVDVSSSIHVDNKKKKINS